VLAVELAQQAHVVADRVVLDREAVLVEALQGCSPSDSPPR